MTPLRLGYIDYLNALPFYHGLAERLDGWDVQFVRGVPTEINRLMREGEVDVALVSSLEYALGSEQYYVLNDSCIGSTGRIRSVVLFSKYPLEELDGKSIALSAESLSSATLLTILLKEKYGFQNIFRSDLRALEDMMEEADAGLLIGDQVFFQSSRDIPYRYDLSEEWYTWQRLPFCFALWVVRRAFADREPERTSALAIELEERARNHIRLLPAFVEGLPIPSPTFSRSDLLEYLEGLTYTLDPEMLQGLERFYEWARQGGVLNREIVLEFPERPTLDVK